MKDKVSDMDETQARELWHKLAIYRQMTDIHPNDTHYLRRLVELLLQLNEEAEAVEQMRRLERLYERSGDSAAAASLKELRHNLPASSDSTSTLNPFMADIRPEALSLLLEDARRIALNEGETLIRQGDEGDSMYLVLDGELAVLVAFNPKKPATLVRMLGEGDIVGEIAFLEGTPRTATVVAHTAAHVLRLSHKHVLKCLLDHPEVGAHLRSESEFRRKVTAIDSNPTLERLPEESKEELAHFGQIRYYKPFHVIGRGRQQLEWAGILVYGLVRVVIEDHVGNSHILDPIKPGDIIGDIHASRSSDSTASDMIAVCDTAILQFPATNFHKVMRKNPLIEQRLLDNIAQRTASTMIKAQENTQE